MASFVPWTPPTAGVHPRIFVNSSTLTTYRTRVGLTGSNPTHQAYWSGGSPVPNGKDLITYVNQRLDTSAFPNSYFDGKHGIYVGSLAFAYLLDNSRTAAADRAIQVALYLAGLSSSTTTLKKRQRTLAMAYVRDWAYARMNSTDRATLRDRIADYMLLIGDINPNERIWGTAHGDNNAAQTALISILSDGTSGENTTAAATMDGLMDVHEDGTNNCYFAPFRYFSLAAGGTGGEIGGSHKGMGSSGYLASSDEFYAQLLPALASGVGVNWYTTEAWYKENMHLYLWNWRGDRTFYRKHEHNASEQYSTWTQIRSIQTADQQNNTFGEHCQWLADEIQAVAFNTIWGPYQVFNILFRNTSRASIRPTTARMGGKRSRFFPRTGTICIHPNWSETGTSAVFADSPFFTSDHQLHDHGGFWLTTQGKPIFITHGHYDPNEDFTYRDPNDATNKSGHRRTFMGSVKAQNVMRIFRASETTSNEDDSFRYSMAASSRFGVWNGTSVTILNDGPQLTPKNTANTDYLPDTLAILLAEPKWNKQGFTAYNEDGTGKFTYACAHLTDWYWSGKCSFYKRHFLYIYSGAIPSWSQDILLIVDDMVFSVDSSRGNKTIVDQHQVQFNPVKVGNTFTVTHSPGKCVFEYLKPASIVHTIVQGHSFEGIPFTAPFPDDNDDSVYPPGVGIFRLEVSPASSGSPQQMVKVYFPCQSSASTFPTRTLIDDGTWLGATINGVECKVNRTTFVGQVGDSIIEPPPPPPPPPPVSGILKTDAVIYRDIDLLSGGANTVSNWVDNNDSFQTALLLRLTNPATAITTPASIQVQVTSNSTTGRIYNHLFRPFTGNIIASNVSQIMLKLPLSIRYFRINATCPTGGTVKIDAEYSKLTRM